MINYAIVDDDLRFANQIKDNLVAYSELNLVKVANSGLTYFEELNHGKTSVVPDCILMDISMRLPDEGIRTSKLLKEKFPKIKVIILSVYDDDERIFEAFKAGAIGYLLKNESTQFIFKAIVEVMNGGSLLSPGIAFKTISYFNQDTSKSTSNKEIKQLTERELEILKLISKGFKYQEIADKLFISLQTVKKHISNIFEKLQVNNKISAINKTKDFL
ncbi:MAG: response regulator transcription factor [Cyclobacteriaceae bacterium]|jgi:DNA-binding NarL/FixJ family response regulator|nr:response regulator transcription factor [Cyclobacteriaceae bacterium]